MIALGFTVGLTIRGLKCLVLAIGLRVAPGSVRL